ncbi:MAG TPA: glycosyltransferase family 4 protein [Conexibacter sp.]|jgi:glycosyltransferase involved in cell wall biosynthesis
MRIVSLVPEGAPSSLYRSIIPMQALAVSGHRVHVEERNAVGDAGPLLDVDAVHLFRLSHQPARRLVRQLRDAGVAVVYDNDFDAGSAPAGHAVARAMRGLGGQQAVASEAAMVRLADVVVAPTGELGDRFLRAGASDVQIIENWLPPTFTRPRTVPGRGITVGWAAMAEHLWDFDALGMREVLAELLTRHQHVRLLAIGADLGMTSPRYEFQPWQPYDALPALLARCDIAIAPLADVPFNQTRSNVKLKEYAAVGVPWLASPVGDYAWMGEQHGGRLVPDGGWAAELNALVRDDQARSRLGVAGLGWARREVVLDHVGELEQLFEHAVAVARDVRRR